MGAHPDVLSQEATVQIKGYDAGACGWEQNDSDGGGEEWLEFFFLKLYLEGGAHMLT